MGRVHPQGHLVSRAAKGAATAVLTFATSPGTVVSMLPPISEARSTAAAMALVEGAGVAGGYGCGKRDTRVPQTSH